MKILIIGAGWYGCHLAKILLEKGLHVVIVDKTNKIFSGSSSKNQNRLHLGFHYPRSKATMIECLEGYTKFIKNYSHLTYAFTNNLYFVSLHHSHIDINTYIDIMQNHITFKEYTDPLPLSILNVAVPTIHVDELYINPFKSSEYFDSLLQPYFKTIDTPSSFQSIDTICQTCAEPFDYVINCTYNMLNPIQFDHYELFVTLLYKINTSDIFAYTIMDGPFFSIYPYDIDNNIYTVTSVKYGIAYNGLHCDYTISTEQLNAIIENMENQIISYIPDWKSVSQYSSYYTSWKTKHDTIHDDRSLKYSYENNIINVYGGKITGIFEAENVVLSLLTSPSEEA